ncbi:MAG: hypothetical protein EPO10_09190 [Reyranella sp.]|uniref:hypothetical protein n=1 Tax=Reyranella sp. TaxID=1929291 RepID=UPI00120751FD|nr:hypothetical protein [Reyranella sp.]TAJ96290.1 MAG: hypothetical protein EPO41_07425 [Reyranella sp.]TBR29189.1 MAG: hypothetical protein EPO10_09190 [Reyranella sp.]
MSSRLLFRLTAVAVVAAGIVMAIGGASMSVWAWNTAGTHIAFELGLPLATVWLVFTLVRLMHVLPEAWRGEEQARDPLTALAAAPKADVDERLRKASPDALSVRQIALPREPERRRRPRIAQRVELRGGRTLYRVQPIRRPPVARRAIAAATVVIASVSLFFLLGPLDLEDVSWIASLFRALEEFPGLFQRVDAVGLLATLGFGARGHQQRL